MQAGRTTVKSARLFVVGVLASIAMLTAFTAPATAVSFSVNSSPLVTLLRSQGKITFSAAGFINIECKMTLQFYMRSGLMEKTSGAQFGLVLEVRSSECVGGIIQAVLTPLPVAYRAILGTLPSSVTALEFSVRIGLLVEEGGGTSCLYRGDVFMLTRFSGTNPYTTIGNVLITGDNIGGGSGICPFMEGSMSGTFSEFQPSVQIRRL